MKKPYKSLKLFENPFLERFSHVHPLVPLMVWSPVVTFLLWRSVEVHRIRPHVLAVLGGLALVAWTLSEYLLHRFIFHFEGESPRARRAHFLMHGMHHDDPMDPTRLVMPPAVSVVLGCVVFSFLRVLLGNVWAEPFFAFYLIGYLCYDYIHFSVHHFQPRSRLGKYYKQNHMAHHYVNSRSRWGVSSPFWDYVFGSLENFTQEVKAGEVTTAEVRAATPQSNQANELNELLLLNEEVINYKPRAVEQALNEWPASRQAENQQATS